MRRRDVIAAGTAVVLGSASAARANDEPAGAPVLNLAAVGLPVIAEGRVRNYVFVTLRLHLRASATPEQLRHKEAFFRDALVKAGHRTPFTVASDWTRLDANAIAASVQRSASGIAGAGVVQRVEIVSQAARRRTGVRAG